MNKTYGPEQPYSANKHPEIHPKNPQKFSNFNQKNFQDPKVNSNPKLMKRGENFIRFNKIDKKFFEISISNRGNLLFKIMEFPRFVLAVKFVKFSSDKNYIKLKKDFFGGKIRCT